MTEGNGNEPQEISSDDAKGCKVAEEHSTETADSNNATDALNSDPNEEEKVIRIVLIALSVSQSTHCQSVSLLFSPTACAIMHRTDLFDCYMYQAPFEMSVAELLTGVQLCYLDSEETERSKALSLTVGVL